MEEYVVVSTKEFTWDCAHVLTGHLGLCRNLHGHTYKMEVTACQLNGEVIQDGPSKGMVVDFKDLKNLITEVIVKPLDHATIIDVSNKDPFEQSLYELLKFYDKKIVEIEYRPTAENMCIHFLDQINAVINERELGFAVVKIRIYETPTSYSEVVC